MGCAVTHPAEAMTFRSGPMTTRQFDYKLIY